MTERVSAIVDAVRLRVEDELRQHLQALDAEYQQRLEEQRRGNEEQRRIAEQAAAALEEQWAGRLADAEARGNQAVATAVERAHAEFETSRASAHERTAQRLAALQEFQHGLDRCSTLTEALNHLAGELRQDEALFLHRDGRWHHWVIAGAPLVPPPGWESIVSLAHSVGAAVRQDDLVAVPIAIEGKVVAALVSRQTEAETEAGGRELIAHAVAARLTAITASRMTQAVRWTQGSTGLPTDGPSPSEAGEADAGAAAQRYARLLISEIKLYNEATVREGRAHRDIAKRLADEITRARQIYEVRVTDDVPGRAHHFQQALVQILADGDATLLG